MPTCAARGYQAVTCRGVLNDMTIATERDAVLRAFAGALSDGGMLVLDVREPDGSRRRADGVRRQRAGDLGARGILEVASTVTWETGLLHVVEDYQLRTPGAPANHRRFDFTMRPSSPRKIRERLTVPGFSRIEIGPASTGGPMTGCLSSPGSSSEPAAPAGSLLSARGQSRCGAKLLNTFAQPDAQALCAARTRLPPVPRRHPRLIRTW
jgi:hypothetical protein